MDKSGRDAYLCAEYLWEGEYYVQDRRFPHDTSAFSMGLDRFCGSRSRFGPVSDRKGGRL